MKRMIYSMAMIVAASLGVSMATAQAPQHEKLTLTAEASPNTAHINGTTGEVALLISVTDPDGNPVTNLQPQNIGVIAALVPGLCGWSRTQVFSPKPGFYQVGLALPNLPQCQWVYGDYLGVVTINTLNQRGIATFKVTIDSATALQ
jgi:hypothetical protein